MKIAIVTGASSGLGREFVKQITRLYKNLDEIWVIARRADKLEELKEQLPVYIRVFAGDMEDYLVYRQVQNRLENQNPDVRMLVNAAGFGKMGTIEEIAAEDKKLQLRMIDLNCRGLTEMTLTCLPYMSKGSRIINVASAAAFCPQSGFAVYAATKSYVLSFSRGLGAEVRKKGIFVTAVCPGPVDTEFFDVAGTNESLMKQSVLSDAPSVVKQALLDARDRKAVSVYGAPMKAARVASKLLPDTFTLAAMEKLGELHN
ncbi:MAG: SDR family NAD(P)-dependent oxidoreductase [Bariatricus sp.]